MLDAKMWNSLSAEQRSTAGDEARQSSPFSLPTHIRCREEGSALLVEFRYVDGEEPMTEAGRSSAGVVALVGRLTGRLRAFSIPRAIVRELIAQVAAQPVDPDPRQRLIKERLTPEFRAAIADSKARDATRQPSASNRRVALDVVAPTLSGCLAP